MFVLYTIQNHPKQFQQEIEEINVGCMEKALLFSIDSKKLLPSQKKVELNENKLRELKIYLSLENYL